MKKESRVAWWTAHRLETVGDLIEYPVQTSRGQGGGRPEGERSASEGSGDHSAEESEDRDGSVPNRKPVPQNLCSILTNISTRPADPVPSTHPAASNLPFHGPPSPGLVPYTSDHAPYTRPPEDGPTHVPSFGDGFLPHPTVEPPPLLQPLPQQSYTLKLDALAEWAGRVPVSDDSASRFGYGDRAEVGEEARRSVGDGSLKVSGRAMPDLFW